jgi:uncharacterized membrane protein
MNGAHLHLIVNHVPLLALMLGAVTLAVSMKRKSSDLRTLATALFLVAGIFGWIAFETGEKAEDVLKALGSEYASFIETHEEAASWALGSGIWVASLAVAAEWSVRKKKKWARALQWALLVFALHSCTVFAITALHGGRVRHTEVRPSP